MKTLSPDYFQTITGRFTTGALRLATQILSRNGDKITAIFPVAIPARELTEVPAQRVGISGISPVPSIPTPTPTPAEARWDWNNGNDSRSLAGYVVGETTTHLKIQAYEAATPASGAEWFPKRDCRVTRWI